MSNKTIRNAEVAHRLRAPVGAADDSPGRKPGGQRENEIRTALPQARGPQQTPLLRLQGWEARAQRNARSDRNQMHFF